MIFNVSTAFVAPIDVDYALTSSVKTFLTRKGLSLVIEPPDPSGDAAASRASQVPA